MINAQDAISYARSLLGTPYSELDCINLIKKVIRDVPGGVAGYTTAGTNALWDSFGMSAKYKDLTWRQAGLAGAQAGMIAFKSAGEDFHHAGIVTGAGTVIHSSSTQGGRGVVETPLTPREGWTHLAKHRYISVQDSGEGSAMGEWGVVRTDGGKLNVRDKENGRVIGQLDNASEIEILQDSGEWLKIVFGERGEGYVFSAYVSREMEERKKFMRITDENGDVYDIYGAFTVRVME